jgi:hypothetical protein
MVGGAEADVIAVDAKRKAAANRLDKRPIIAPQAWVPAWISSTRHCEAVMAAIRLMDLGYAAG